MVRAMGAAHLVDQDSNGLGLFDAWALRFACGLEVCLWMFQRRSDGTPIEDATELATIEVHANEAHERHLRFHLPVPLVDVSYGVPSPLVEETRSWRVARQDDAGVCFEIARYGSRCEAEAVAEAFERRGHKQRYWVEETAG